VDLSSRLRAIVRSGPQKAAIRELTYEPDTGRYETTLDIDRVGDVLGGRVARTPFGQCLVIDRRYEAERWHGDIRIGDCELRAGDGLSVLDPALPARLADQADDALSRAVFIDLETTGLSGGAGTVAFLVGLAFFDLGAFQVRQFLLTSYAAERALLAAVAECFEDADLIVTYNGKTFDVPVMETRWVFHRMELPLDGIPHFDMLHPARRLWKMRTPESDLEEGGCRLSTLERALFDVRRVGDVSGFEIPGRYFQFLRNGDPRPLEPVLEHNRLDLVSLAAVTAHAVRLAEQGVEACRDGSEALALGRVYERAGDVTRAGRCYERGAASTNADVRAESLYRVGLRHRRERRFAEAADVWRSLLELAEGKRGRTPAMESLRQFAVEALAIHEEHRTRDFEAARELAMFSLEEQTGAAGRRRDSMRHRLARLERKISRGRETGLFPG
jgi:uncharacterized protein YprB with RNaseH-like and TPR domain